MESVVGWVQGMIDEGYSILDIRVNEPWASAIIASGLVPAHQVVDPYPAEEGLIALVASDGKTYYANLVAN